MRIDMENSPYTAVTLDVFETMWQQGYRNVGVVLQSCLPRSEADAAQMNALGARVRLVKGAYKEPRDVAYQTKADVDAAFVRIMKLLLAGGAYPAIATHDPGDDRGDARVRGGTRRRSDRATSSRCSTASAATCRPRCVARVTGCASTFHSAVNGSPTSCAGWANAPPTSVSSFAASSASAEVPTAHSALREYRQRFRRV